MDKDTSKQVERIHRFGISCTLNDNGSERYFQNGHEYVDLGLPSGTKWATMNIGANDITYIGTNCPIMEDDESNTNCHISCKIPSKMQFNELIDGTTSLPTEINGIKGHKFINKTDESKWIFLPYGGIYQIDMNRVGNYVFCMKFYEDKSYLMLWRCDGALQIREVLSY